MSKEDNNPLELKWNQQVKVVEGFYRDSNGLAKDVSGNSVCVQLCNGAGTQWIPNEHIKVEDYN